MVGDEGQPPAGCIGSGAERRHPATPTKEVHFAMLNAPYIAAFTMRREATRELRSIALFNHDGLRARAICAAILSISMISRA